MSKMNLRKILTHGLLSISIIAVGSASYEAKAGLIILEGSDAQTFHGLQPYSDNFQTGLQIYSSAPLLPVLAIGSDPVGNAPAGTVFLASLFGVDLMDYSGLYIGSPGTCCDENAAVIAGYEASILAFSTAGRSVAIGNYQGGSAFAFLTGFTLTGIQAIGYNTPGGGAGCFDGNVIATAGGVFGLGTAGDTLPSIGCFGHQAYLSSFLVANGFGFNLADNPGFPGYTVVASNGGGGISEQVPEPSTIALIGMALISLFGFGMMRRRADA